MLLKVGTLFLLYSGYCRVVHIDNSRDMMSSIALIKKRENISLFLLRERRHRCSGGGGLSLSDVCVFLDCLT